MYNKDSQIMAIIKSNSYPKINHDVVEIGASAKKTFKNLFKMVKSKSINLHTEEVIPLY